MPLGEIDASAGAAIGGYARGSPDRTRLRGAGGRGGLSPRLSLGVRHEYWLIWSMVADLQRSGLGGITVVRQHRNRSGPRGLPSLKELINGLCDETDENPRKSGHCRA